MLPRMPQLRRYLVMGVAQTGGQVTGPRRGMIHSTTSRAGNTERDPRLHVALAVICVGAIVAVLADAAAATGGLAGFNDFYREAWPSYHAIRDGNVLSFLDLGPAYIGSLILRLPFALIPTIWGGGAHAVYFASALPCLLAAPILGGWLLRDAQSRQGHPSPLGLALFCALNPVMVMATFGGHPEEVLGATLCVAAVIAAARERAGWCTVFLSLAIINKTWALAAVPVALAALPRDRMRTLLITAAASGGVLIPVTAIRASQSVGTTAAIAGTGIGSIFNPPQLLWWFGRDSWIAPHARLLIVGLAALLGGLWWLRMRTESTVRAADRALPLLALVLLLRAALDPWNNPYYHLPFLFALLAYEAYTRRWPALTLVYSVLLVIVAPVNGVAHPTGDVQAAAYAAIALPMIAWLAIRAFTVHGRPDTDPAKWRSKSASRRAVDELSSA